MKTDIKDIRIIIYDQKYKDQVIKLIGDVLQELKVIPISDKPLDDKDLYQIPEIYKDRGCFWIALDGEKIVGTVGIREIDKNTAKLKRMFVDPKYRGSGIAKKLLDTAIDFANSCKYTNIILNTHIFMTRAHRFYEKNGFIKISEEPDKYQYKFELN